MICVLTSLRRSYPEVDARNLHTLTYRHVENKKGVIIPLMLTTWIGIDEADPCRRRRVLLKWSLNYHDHECKSCQVIICETFFCRTNAIFHYDIAHIQTCVFLPRWNSQDHVRSPVVHISQPPHKNLQDNVKKFRRDSTSISTYTCKKMIKYL